MRDAADRLANLIEFSLSALTAISPPAAAAPLLPGGWSAKQVIGHLIDSASNNHQRFVRAALQGQLDWPGYDQNGCVSIEAFQEAEWAMLIDTWSAMNCLIAHVLAHLPAESAGAACRIGTDLETSLRELADAYISHLEHHLAQLGIPT